MLDSTLLKERKKKLSRWIKEHQTKGCLILDPVNLYYYTGVHISTGVLFVGERTQALIVDHRYYERCKKEVPFKVLPTTNFKKTLKAFPFPETVAMDSYCTHLKDYELISEFCKVISYPNFLAQMRMVKDAYEIRKIKKSCQITKEGFAYIQKHFKAGITELELTEKLELFLRAQGAQKMAFDPIVAFGKNAANPHYNPRKVKLKKNDLILIDCGVVYDGYHSDMTRTFVKGQISNKMMQYIEWTEQAQKEAVKICRPGLKIAALNAAVQKIYKRFGVEKLFIHGLGHGVGLEIHELPTLGAKEMTLEEGMVITIEPGLYDSSVGGVRIEDSILITEKGYKNLTR